LEGKRELSDRGKYPAIGKKTVLYFLHQRGGGGGMLRNFSIPSIDHPLLLVFSSKKKHVEGEKGGGGKGGEKR